MVVTKSGFTLIILQRDKENLTTQQFNISIIEDLISVIKGPNQQNPLQHVMAALSELIDMFQKSLIELSQGKHYLSYYNYNVVQPV